MIEITSLEECTFKDHDQVVVALGFFDGLHLAHQKIIGTCKKQAKKRDGKSVIFTFQNHPSSVLTPDQTTRLLTPYLLKLQLLEKMGIDAVVGVMFDIPTSSISAEQFIEDILIKSLFAKEVVAGFNFAFGRERKGQVDTLKSYESDKFDKVSIVEPLYQAGQPISSTLIRNKLYQGELDSVSELLGRPYQLFGTVIRGDNRGKSIGFPTANLEVGGQILPPNGVYGVQVRQKSLSAPPMWGVMNIGVIPTFKDKPLRSVEVHLLDCGEDLYGTNLIVDILYHLRGELKFPGPEALVEQINKDIVKFRTWIKEKSTEYEL